MSLSSGLPKFFEPIYQKFYEGKYELYLIGGSVRKLLLFKDNEINDWDLTTNATPEEMLKLFPHAFYDNKFGTVGIPIQDKSYKKGVIEITTFRSESEYKNRRKPEKITWGKTIEEDLQRRDFTINAIAMKISGLGDKPAINISELIDLYDGKGDLERKIIKAVGNPDERFKEDALRLMRAIRFATELSFVIEEKTLKAIKNDSLLIKEISNERVRDELIKILSSNNPYGGVMMLYETGLLENILPELLKGVGISQERPGRHHTTDVFTHNVLSLKFCTSSNPIIRFAALIHDIGKPQVKSLDEDGLVIFHNHEVSGAKIAWQICERLKFSKKDREKVVNLVRWHMFTVDEKITDSAVRRFIRRVGVESVKDMMDLRIGDRLGGGTQTAESWRLKLFKKRIEDQLKPLPFSINDLVIDGGDIMKILNIKPGPKIGEILQKIFEEVDEDLSLNNKDYLEKRIKELQ